jgi:glycosyltransferase involved in cell wall biosynthesis
VTAGTETQRTGGRALFVLPADVIGGAERLTIGLVAAAVESRVFARADVFVLAQEPTGSLSGVGRLPGVHVTHARARREYAAVAGFDTFLRGTHYDFTFSTHTHVNALCCVMRRLGRLRTARLVTRESSSIFEVELGRYKAVVPLLVRLYGNQDCLVHQTGYMCDSFNRHTGGRLASRCRIVPNPIDLDKVRRGAAEAARTSPWPDAIHIVWCGRLAPLKSPHLALETLQQLQATAGARHHLHFIGDGPLRNALADAAAQAGLAANVTFHGQLENPWAIMARCDAGLMTSAVEGFPNVVLEMLASGTRGVASTNCAGDLDQVPGVRVVARGEAALLAQAVREAVAGPAPAALEAHLRGRTPEAFLRSIVTGD